MTARGTRSGTGWASPRGKWRSDHVRGVLEEAQVGRVFLRDGDVNGTMKWTGRTIRRIFFK